jgi:hypothetical protein
LSEYDFDHTALLYVGVPFLIAMILSWVDRPKAQDSWRQGLFNNLVVAMIVMLGSSVVLFEGFLCVVMFMPIYLLVILVTFIYRYGCEYFERKRTHRTYMHVLPLLLLFSALEGTHPDLTAPRHEQVTVTQTVAANIDEVWAQLAKPPQFQVERSWFLSMFPMPYKVEYDGLQAGDVHRIHFRYHRWFFTNTHTGTMTLKINSVSRNHLQASFIDDDSYLATYVGLEGSHITLEPIDEFTTQISLTIDYQRKLDPAWYFTPLQQFGLTEFGRFVITQLATPK